MEQPSLAKVKGKHSFWLREFKFLKKVTKSKDHRFM
jgi:hypothetical protein